MIVSSPVMPSPEAFGWGPVHSLISFNVDCTFHTSPERKTGEEPTEGKKFGPVYTKNVHHLFSLA